MLLDDLSRAVGRSARRGRPADGTIWGTKDGTVAFDLSKVGYMLVDHEEQRSGAFAT